MKKSYLAWFILFLLSHAAHATNVEYNGTVKGFYINNSGIVLVSIHNSALQPQCNDQVWPFTFNVTDISAQSWLSMLLTSRTTRDTIKLGYTPSGTGRCTINYFYYLD